MAKDTGRKRLPPYISYRTFQNFTDGLQQGIPSRIDRSYWGDRVSGGTGTQLMAALRFLALIDANGTPTARLRQLASTRGAQRAEALRTIVLEAFSFLQVGSFDSQNGTYSQLVEVFHSTFELTDSVTRKCVKFFVAMASDAGMPLSPFIVKRVRLSAAGSGTKQSGKRKVAREKRNFVIPQSLEEIPSEVSWERTMLGKFPTFDPSWSDDVKLGWLEAFWGLKFPSFNPLWSDEVKLKWFEAYYRLLDRGFFPRLENK